MHPNFVRGLALIIRGEDTPARAKLGRYRLELIARRCRRRPDLNRPPVARAVDHGAEWLSYGNEATGPAVHFRKWASYALAPFAVYANAHCARQRLEASQLAIHARVWLDQLLGALAAKDQVTVLGIIPMVVFLPTARRGSENAGAEIGAVTVAAILAHERELGPLQIFREPWRINRATGFAAWFHKYLKVAHGKAAFRS